MGLIAPAIEPKELRSLIKRYLRKHARDLLHPLVAEFLRNDAQWIARRASQRQLPGLRDGHTGVGGERTERTLAKMRRKGKREKEARKE
jgi:hypothetical protein